MNWHILPLTDAPAIPWKNGGGITRELVVWPEAQTWTWRMSVADIARNGPFSCFEGIERWVAVLTGNGVQLDVGKPPNAAVHLLTPDAAPLGFAGESPADCTLVDGGVLAFNLMLRQGAAKGRMLRIAGGHALIPVSSKIIAVYAVSTGASIHFDDEVLNLSAHTLVWRECLAGSKVQVHAEQALWIEIG